MAPGRKGLNAGHGALCETQPHRGGWQVRLHTSAAAQDQDENSILPQFPEPAGRKRRQDSPSIVVVVVDADDVADIIIVIIVIVGEERIVIVVVDIVIIVVDIREGRRTCRCFVVSSSASSSDTISTSATPPRLRRLLPLPLSHDHGLRGFLEKRNRI
jgi:hypothetical protein